MYQVIGLSKTLTLFGFICLAVFVLQHHDDFESLLNGSLLELRKGLMAAISFGAIVFYVLGETPLFVMLCKFPFIRKMLPPISGEWDVQLASNWGVIQKWLGQGDGKSLHVVTGKARIKARFFSVKIEFISLDQYSESKTLSVSVRPSDQAGLIELNYMYANFTRIPQPTDASTHTGAARVFVKEAGNGLVMEGTYFTDRKWTEGLNTAGAVTFTRAKP
jgi:hypothetical protein